MGSFPPKEGIIKTSSTKLWAVVLLIKARKYAKAIRALKQIIKDGGY